MLSLDAMRGGAAFFVVLYHALSVAPLTAPGGWQWWLPTIASWVSHYGYAGVFLFFVISGFCIHLQWAKAKAAGVENPHIAFFKFVKRRGRRLYIPYLAALLLYLGHTAYQSPIEVTPFYLWDVGLHFLMLHNLDVRTSYSINGAFWTLAIEGQLYLAYFLLLFLRIRYGWARTLVISLAARFGWIVLGRSLAYFTGIEIPMTEAAATNWFVWALGALSVEAALGLVKLPAWCSKIWVGALALLCAMALAEGLPLMAGQLWLHDAGWFLMHPAWGLGFFVLVNYAVRVERRWQEMQRSAPRFVSCLAALGLISYSLYLTHHFVLMKWYWFGFTQYHILTISLMIMVPLSILFAYLFYRLFERPFMTARPNAKAASLSTRNESFPQTAEPISEPISG
jgi:peptidoglycan/LPS O-acetylase OafA/YrhL